MEFSGIKALVTGSAKGLGRQVALDLASQGADVCINYRHSKKEAEEVVRDIRKMGQKSFALKADVAKAKDATRLVNDAANKLGGLDILVNNVGNYLKKDLSEVTAQEWEGMIAGNLNCTFYCTQAALPRMRKQKFGRIVNMGVAGSAKIEPKPATTAYSIAKTGVLMLTKTVAATEAKNGITCNMVSPGVMERSVVHPQMPMGRDAKLEEVSRAVLFLASRKSGYITGQNMEVAGAYKL